MIRSDERQMVSPRSVVEAGVGEIEIVADADGTCVRMVSSEDRVAIHRRGGFCKGEAGYGRERECGGEGGRVRDEAAASEAWPD